MIALLRTLTCRAVSLLTFVAACTRSPSPPASPPPAAARPTVPSASSLSSSEPKGPAWRPLDVTCAKVAALAVPSPSPQWRSRASGTEAALKAVHGKGDEVWIAGASGVALHTRDGGTSFERCTLAGDLSAVWTFGADDVWFGGENGLVHHDASGWTALGMGSVVSLWGASPDDLWLTTRDRIYRVSKRTVREVTACGASIGHLWGRSADDVWVGCASSVLHSDDGGVSWGESNFVPTVESNYRVHGAGSEIWIVGSSGTGSGSVDASFDGGLTFVPQPLPVGLHHHRDVSALGVGRAVVVGTGAFVRLGKTWTRELPVEVSLEAAWGTSPTDVWAVGDRGVVLHRP